MDQKYNGLIRELQRQQHNQNWFQHLATIGYGSDFRCEAEMSCNLSVVELREQLHQRRMALIFWYSLQRSPGLHGVQRVPGVTLLGEMKAHSS